MSLLRNAIGVVFAGALLAQENPQTILRQAQADLAAGRYASVIKRGTQAVTLFKQAGDQPGTIRALTNVGLAQMYSGEYDPALANFTEAKDVSQRSGDLEYEITLLNNLGTVLYFKGRYADAMDRYRLAAAAVDRSPAAAWLPSRKQLTMANTAILYQTLGQYDRALTLYNGLLQTPQALSPREEAQVLANVGVLRRRLGDPQKALDTYRAAQELYRKSGHRDGEIAILNNIGIVQALDLKNFKAAAATFTTALQLAEQSGDRPLSIHSRLYRGEALFRDDRAGEAAADFEAARSEAAALGEQEEEWKAEYGLARIAARQQDGARAKDLLTRAVKRIETLRAGLGSSSLRSAFLADKRDVYDLLIEGSDKLDEMFRYMEQSRARGLKDGRALQAPSLVELARRLSGDTVVLEYWVGEASAAVVWIAAGKSGVKRWRWSKEERGALAALPQILSDPKRADWGESLGPLGRNLLEGIEPLQDSRIQKLIVVPDGSLAQIPFEALPFSKGMLLERFTVSYLPAAALLPAASASRPLRWFWQPSLRALADPAPGNGNDPLVSAGTWQRLPAAAREIHDIAAALGGRASLYSGSAATKAELLRAQTSPVLHFATHAFADLENPDLSYILLAPASAAQRFDYLFLKEVGELPLRGVDLVALSACQTAVGKSVPGEGVQSFSGAFLAAGVPTVVTSLWSVNDQVTAELMARMYSRLAGGDSAADALRGAQLEVLRTPNHAHPAYWAAFVVHGDGQLRLPYVVGRKWLLLPLALLLATVFAIRKRVGRA